MPPTRISPQTDWEGTSQKNLKMVGLVKLMSMDETNGDDVEPILTIEEICEPAQWQLIKGPWMQFLQASKIHDPFLSFEWFDCCLRSFQSKKTLFVLHVKEHSTILGIAPFCGRLDRFKQSFRYWSRRSGEGFRLGVVANKHDALAFVLELLQDRQRFCS